MIYSTMDQVFVPMLSYEDGVAAMEWLKSVFSFTETTRWLDDDGKLSHGELELGGQRLMLATPSPEYQSPKTVREHYPPAAEVSKLPYVMDGVVVYVASVAETYDLAKSNGAVILSEIAIGPPGTRFRMEDLEGHRWYVMEASTVSPA
jgi:uncharacterized glyoxalase superfamily protein PhnB